jgi:hypothetical protein
MKTIRKAMLGILFLAPLFLPAKTKAGGFDEWIHSWFRSNDHREARPTTPGYGYDARNPYRQYDPYHMGGGRPGTRRMVIRKVQATPCRLTAVLSCCWQRVLHWAP